MRRKLNEKRDLPDIPTLLLRVPFEMMENTV